MSSVSLIIPYFEAGELLLHSLESVQLRASDLIIVVDDGSRTLPATNYCPKQVGSTPVNLVTYERNRGITSALLAGIATIPKGTTYIARLDCGDISSNDRFEIQRNYLDQHPGYGIVSSSVEYIDPSGRSLYMDRYPTTSSAIRRRMRVNSAFCHSGSMFRHDIYEEVGGYSQDYPAAEDYELFRRMLNVTEGANIHQALIKCTTSDGGISERNRKRQLLSRLKVMRAHFDWHPLSFYGIARTTAQLGTSRRMTTALKRIFR